MEDDSVRNIDDPNENIPIESLSDERLAIPTLKEEFPRGKVNILLVGNTGVGKSMLVNLLLDKKIAPVTHGARATKHDLVEKYLDIVFDVKVTVYDTRGLSDPESKSSSVIAEIKKVFNQDEMDIVIICQAMTERMNESCVKTLQLLAKSYDIDVWRKCIFVLTKANVLEQSILDDQQSRDQEELKKTVDEIRMSYVQTFRQYLQEAGVKDDVTLDIPVCLTGNKELELALVENWILELFYAFSKRCSPRSRCSVTNLREMRRKSILSSVLVSSAVGATAGGIVLPVVGIPIGLTVGAIVGMTVGYGAFKSVSRKISK